MNSAPQFLVNGGLWASATPQTAGKKDAAVARRLQRCADLMRICRNQAKATEIPNQDKQLDDLTAYPTLFLEVLKLKKHRSLHPFFGVDLKRFTGKKTQKPGKNTQKKQKKHQKNTQEINRRPRPQRKALFRLHQSLQSRSSASQLIRSQPWHRCVRFVPDRSALNETRGVLQTNAGG